MRTREIDPVAAIRLLNEGRSYAEIGRILAAEIGRRSAFHRSVCHAIRAHDREATSQDAPRNCPDPARAPTRPSEASTAR